MDFFDIFIGLTTFSITSIVNTFFLNPNWRLEKKLISLSLSSILKENNASLILHYPFINGIGLKLEEELTTLFMKINAQFVSEEHL